uniref:MIF4G domain-containing protein n=1 Tax=Panagrolaimus superbus TaxID=310955 RepID=A0A914XZ35_9BILA
MVLLCDQRSKNAWIPYFLKEDNDLNNNIDETIRTVRGLLNKITTKKFDILLQDLKEIDFWYDKEAVTKVSSIIFEQAIQAPTYVELYANLCKQIHQAERELNKVQAWFRAALVPQIQTLVEATTDNQKSGNTYANEYARMKEKRDMIGLLRFVAHLYRVQLINYKILENCLVVFIRSYEESKNETLLESAVLLLIISGPLVDNGDERIRIDSYSQYCERYKPNVCKRIKFKIDDLLQLRQHNWV